MDGKDSDQARWMPWLNGEIAWHTSFLSVLLCTGLEVIKLFPCSTQMSIKFIMLINVKMPTFVGILTYISLINTTSESLKARKVYTFKDFSFYEQLKFHVQLRSA